MGLAHGKLSYSKPQELKPNLPLIGFEGIVLQKFLSSSNVNVQLLQKHILFEKTSTPFTRFTFGGL